MESSFTATLESHIVRALMSDEAAQQYQGGDLSHRTLEPYAAALQALSSSYTSHSVGTKLRKEITLDLEASAYALYYLPINAAKIAPLLPLAVPSDERIRVLDFGCGPATASLALIFNLAPDSTAKVDLTCIDSSAPMRATAQKLLSKPPVIDRLTNLSIGTSIPAGSFDLIIASNVLAELDQAREESLVETLIERLTPEGRLLIMEPGQQAHTRRLMEIRDRLLLRSPDITPLFPCLRRDACPMLSQSPQDWCHGMIEWQQPPLSRQFDRILGFNKHRIKFAAFVFQRGGSMRPGTRVITQPRKTARGIETLVCGQDQYGLATIRKGARTTANRVLEKANVFDRLLFSQPLVGDLPASLKIERLGI